MDLPPCTLQAAKEEDGWQIVTPKTDWWRTPFGSVSWSYFTNTKFRFSKTRQYSGSVFLRLMPSDASSSSSRDQLDSPTDVTLNPDLCGVRGATDAVCIYEANVGFHHSTFPDLHLDRSSRDLSVEVDENQVRLGKEQWDGLVESLGALTLDEERSDEGSDTGIESGESSPSSGLHRSTSTLSSVDSDLSTDSISFPSTPKAKHFDANVHIKDSSLSSSTYFECSSPARPLNASASSFVPSFIKPKIEPIAFPSIPSPSSSPSPPPVFVNFTFPTLDVSPLAPVKIKKDEHGFYSEVKSPSLHAQMQNPSIDLLPPFLQERRKGPTSKTRAMVDRLRSSHQSEENVRTAKGGSMGVSHCRSPSPSSCNFTIPQDQLEISNARNDRGASVPSVSLDEDEDGWINLAGTQAASPEAKARRTKDLFLALTRRRSDSLPAVKVSGSEETQDPVMETICTTVSSPSLSPAVSTKDSWLDDSAISQKPPTPCDLKSIRPRARTDSRPRSRASRKRRSSNLNNVAVNSPLISHPFMPPTNPIARPPVGAGIFHPAASISFPVQPPFFSSPYPQMMMPMAPYAPYMLQMQMQAQAQAQMRGHRLSASTGGEWFPYPQGVRPFMNPNPNLVTNMNMTPTPTKRGSLHW